MSRYIIIAEWHHGNSLVLLQMLETPLIRCAHNGHFESVQFLVEQGADVNAIDLVRDSHIALCSTPYLLPSDVLMFLGYNTCLAALHWNHPETR